MKIAVFGGTGLLGSNLIKEYAKLNIDVKAFSRDHSSNIDKKHNRLIDFNKLEEELMQEYINWKPDITINTIALVNLQLCEDNYQLAKKVNSDLAVSIANLAKSINSYFIHISTDHYYNDTKKLHTEQDETNLLNNYAKTKYLAEQEILKLEMKSLIVRTNIIGFRNTLNESFFEWLLQSLLKKQDINLYTNFYTSPIAVTQLGKILLQCYEKKLQGIYNISSKETISKYDFGIKTAVKFNLTTNHIAKSTLNNENSVLNRALTLGLDVSKIEKALNIKMPTIDKSLGILYDEYKEI